jgi:hypothetical protein
MVTTALVLAAVLAAPAQPTPLIPLDRGASVAQLPWNECGTEPPDWREPHPLVVLSDYANLDGHSDLPPLAATAFALYADGSVFTRELGDARFRLHRAQLSPRQVESLLASLKLPDLLKLPAHLEAPSPYPPGTIVCDGGPEQLTLQVWVDGCRRAISVTNLTALALGLVEKSGVKRLGKAMRAERRAALRSLPPALATAVRTLVNFRPPNARLVCADAACFDRRRMLPNQLAWRPE